MFDKWQTEIDEACEEIAQLDDELKLEMITEGFSDRYERLKTRRDELYDQIAITVYVDWKFRR